MRNINKLLSILKKFRHHRASALFIVVILNGCNINSPDEYLKQLLTDASDCKSNNLSIIKERYIHPSTIWTVSCGKQKFDCYERRYGFDLTSGNVQSKIQCDVI